MLPACLAARLRADHTLRCCSARARSPSPCHPPPSALIYGRGSLPSLHHLSLLSAASSAPLLPSHLHTLAAFAMNAFYSELVKQPPVGIPGIPPHLNQ